MKKKPKCTIKKGFVIPCDTLQDSFMDNNRQGLSPYVIYNLETAKPKRSHVLIKSGQFKKNGIIANYCPFCGTMIQNLDRGE